MDMPRRLTNLRIDEVSSVDRGAGEGVKVALMKRDTLAGSPDTIKRESDALKALELAIGSIGNDPAKLVECFKQFHEFLGAPSPSTETEMTPEEINKLVAEAVAKALEEAEKKKSPAKPKNTNSTSGEMDAPDDQADGSSASDGANKSLDTEKADVAKADKVDVELAKRDAQIIDLSKTVKELRDRAATEEFGKRAVAIGLTKAEGEHLRKAYAGDVASLKFLEDTIGKLHTQVEKAGLFGEVGSAGGSPATPHDELVSKAQELMKTNDKLTQAQAYVEAMKVYPEIAKREAEARHAKVQKLAQ